MKTSGSKKQLVAKLRDVCNAMHSTAILTCNVDTVGIVATVDTVDVDASHAVLPTVLPLQVHTGVRAGFTATLDNELTLAEAARLLYLLQVHFNDILAEEMWGDEAPHYLHKWNIFGRNALKFIHCLDCMNRAKLVAYVENKYKS